MTKSHVVSYLGIVLVVTIAAYIYTSIAEAPDHKPDANTPTVESPRDVENETVVPATGVAPDVAQQTPSTLTAVAWQWVQTEDAAGVATFVPTAPQKFVMEFSADGRMSSKTDCNSVGGSYEIVGDTLTFGPLMSTLMYCEDSDEAVYNASLAQVASFVQSADTLRLRFATSGAMVFAAVDRE